MKNLCFSGFVETPAQYPEQRRTRPDLGPHRHRLRDPDPAAGRGRGRRQLGSLPDNPDQGSQKFQECEGGKYR